MSPPISYTLDIYCYCKCIAKIKVTIFFKTNIILIIKYPNYLKDFLAIQILLLFLYVITSDKIIIFKFLILPILHTI